MTSHQAGQLDSLLGMPEYRAFCRVELDDPYPLLDELRSAAPVHWSPPLEAWVITSYQGVVAALGHPQLSSDRSAINARGIPTSFALGTGRSSRTSPTGSGSSTRRNTHGCAGSPTA